MTFAHGPSGQLAWLEHGSPDARTAVVGLHGTPGGRHSAIPDEAVLHDLALRYLTFDRPGYGLSDPAPGRSVAAVADDVVAVADAAGAGRFAVVGGSGGSAFALAVAALHPQRVESVALIVPTAPRIGTPAMGTEAWFAGMNPDMAELHRLAAKDPTQLRAVLSDQPGLSADLDGLVEDLVSLHQDWGFDVRAITAPTSIWYGNDDTNAPPDQARWLLAHLPHATARPQDGDHSWPAARMRDIFTDIAAAA